MSKTIISFLCSCMLQPLAFGAQVDTITTISATMHKKIKAVVITPETASQAKRCPVVYLLHGFSDDYATWILKVPQLAHYADMFHLIIVCPDGGNNSWYFDSPADSTLRYETYISKELVGWIDSAYPTIANRTGRAIAGSNMGGHGALFLTFYHQDVFGAAGSMSGAVDLQPFPAYWDLPKVLGNYADNPLWWRNHSVINMLYLVQNKNIPLIVDCGTEDFLYPINKKLHEQLLEKQIPHDFISRPGANNWFYWGKSIGYQLMFMRQFFDRNNL